MGTHEEARAAKIAFYAKAGAGESYVRDNKEIAELRLRHKFEYRVISRFAKGRVLDAGAGYGRLSLLLAEDHEVVSLDTSEDMLAQLRSARTQDNNPTTVVGEVEHIPLPDASFDTVISTRVLVHLPTYKEALKEYARVLKPGGIMMFDIASQHRLAFRNFFRRLVGKKALPPELSPDPSKFFNSQPYSVIKKYLEEQGMVVVHRYPFALLRTVVFENRVIHRDRMSRVLENKVLFTLFWWLEVWMSYVLPTSWTPYYMVVAQKNKEKK